MTCPPLRVLHVITGLERGGAETALVRLLGGLEPARFSSCVISLTDRGSLGAEVVATGADLRALGWRRGRLPRPGQLWQLAGAIRTARPDLVQTWLYHADLAGLLASRLAGAPPLLWNIRCSDMDFRNYGRGTRLTVRLAARLSALPAGVVVNSEAGRRVHAGLGYRPRAWHTIANGIDTGRFRPDPEARARWRAAAGIEPDLRLIGHVARLDPQKDHDTFLRALSLLVGEGATFRAILVGRETETLAPRVAALGLGGHVLLLGECADIAALMPALDLFCMSSAYGEGFPNVLAEAMACGIPATATAVGDAGAILAAPERLVPPRDPGALAAALATMLRWTPAQHRVAADAGRRHIEDCYTLARTVARYADLYRSVAARTRT